MIFGRFEVFLHDHHLEATAWGEKVQPEKHVPTVELKGLRIQSYELSTLKLISGWLNAW